MIFKHTVLILVLVKIALSYKQYKYHELCTGNKFKAIFDSYTNNKPEVRLGEGVESAALLHYRSNSSTVGKIGRCDFSVKLDNPGGSKGIFVSIKKLKLRQNSYGSYGDYSCKDFLRFTYKNGTRTREICGDITTSVRNNLIQNFFDETSGELKVEISIDTTYLSEYSQLEVDLVFTAYSKCHDDTRLSCSPEKCIWNIFRDDKILNCPPPGCLDESECVNNEIPAVVSVKDESSGSPHFIVPLVVVVIAALIGILCFCKKKKTTTNSQRSNDEHVQETRPSARSDLDSYLEFQDVRPIPLVPDQQHYRPTPVAEHGGLMPLVPPNQRYDRPMPSAPKSDFNDDPPPYDALFSTNQNKRTNV